MNKTFCIYCASPISGMDVDVVFGYYDNIIKKFPNACVLHPMIGKDVLRCDLEFKAHGYKGNPLTSNHAILQRDTWMVQQSDIVFLNLANAKERVSIGSCMELAIAYYLRKYVVAVIPEDNIHNHAFVLEAADVIFKDEGTAIDYINKLINMPMGN